MIPDLEFDCEACQEQADIIIDIVQNHGEPTSATMEQAGMVSRYTYCLGVVHERGHLATLPEMVLTEEYPLPGCRTCSNESDQLVEDLSGEYPPNEDGNPPTLAIGILAMGFHCLGLLHARNHPMGLIEYGRSMLDDGKASKDREGRP